MSRIDSIWDFAYCPVRLTRDELTIRRVFSQLAAADAEHPLENAQHFPHSLMICVGGFSVEFAHCTQMHADMLAKVLNLQK